VKKYEFPAGIHFTKLVRTILISMRVAKKRSKIRLALDVILYKRVLTFLSDTFSDVVYKYGTERDYKIGEAGDKIWTMWWQGEDEAPPLIKRCIESMRKNARGREVVVVDSRNVFDYIKLPRHILDKHEAGLITTTLLSDIVRVSLLAQYGGLWLDSTIFCAKEIPEDIWKMPLYTVKPRLYPNAPNIENTKIKPGKKNAYNTAPFIPFDSETTLGVVSGHPLYSFTRDMLIRYWEKYTTMVVYHLFACVLKLAYFTVDVVKQDVDAIPTNSDDFYKLAELFVTKHRYDQKEIDAIISSDTVFYKLDRKEKYTEYNDMGEETAYGRFVKGCLM